MEKTFLYLKKKNSSLGLGDPTQNVATSDLRGSPYRLQNLWLSDAKSYIREALGRNRHHRTHLALLRIQLLEVLLMAGLRGPFFHF